MVPCATFPSLVRGKSSEMGKTFVNSPFMDSANNYGPPMGFKCETMGFLTLSTVLYSCSYVQLSEKQQKNEHDNVFAGMLKGEWSF